MTNLDPLPFVREDHAQVVQSPTSRRRTLECSSTASVIGYVEVPDVRKTGLALSGLVVKSAGRPTLQRVFLAGEPIALAFQLARANDAPRNATVRYVLTDALGQTLSSVAVQPATRVHNGIEEYDVTARLPGQPGRYVAAIEASDGRHAERREVHLTVR